MKIPLSPLRFLQRAAAVHPDRTAIIDGPRTFTYAVMAAAGHPTGERAAGQGLTEG